MHTAFKWQFHDLSGVLHYPGVLSVRLEHSSQCFYFKNELLCLIQVFSCITVWQRIKELLGSNRCHFFPFCSLYNPYYATDKIFQILKQLISKLLQSCKEKSDLEFCPPEPYHWCWTTKSKKSYGCWGSICQDLWFSQTYLKLT